MFELSFNQVMKHMGVTLILKDLNFQVYAGERVGIVGANGCGKSTILKMIAGIEPLNLYPGSWSKGYDFGWIAMPREATVAYLDQIPNFPAHYSVKDVLNLAFEEVLELEQQMRELEQQMQTEDAEMLEKIMKRYARLTESYEVKGGYDMQEKFGKICTGLKLSDSFLEKPFAQLSGGEKTTVMLGKLLMDKPDILLLDEPTNHLDTESIEWLETYLSQYSGIIIIVSHDRYFLDNTVNKIIEIEDMTAQTFKGNYSAYVAQKEEQMRIQYEDYREQQKKINNMEKTVKELRDWALKADNNKFFRRAASIQIKLDKLERVDRPVFERPNMRLNLKTTQRSGNEVIKAVEVSKRFEDKVILENADLMVQYGERVGLVGPNGCGKTTFMKMLLGELPTDGGHLTLGANVKAAYLPQEITFINEEHTVLECFRDEVIILEGKAREYLAKYMFYGKRVFTKVRELSGGERIRLKLAKLLYEEVNLLILDEPTNHLDIDSIETFEEALEDFNGTIFFISHDRYFINKIAQRLVAIENKQLKGYEGNYDFYKETRSAQIERTALTFMSEEPSQVKAEKTVADEKVAVKNKAVREPLALSSEDLEMKIEACETAIAAVDEAMRLAGQDYQQLSMLHLEKEALSQTLEQLWHEWAYTLEEAQ